MFCEVYDTDNPFWFAGSAVGSKTDSRSRDQEFIPVCTHTKIYFLGDLLCTNLYSYSPAFAESRRVIGSMYKHMYLTGYPPSQARAG